MILIPDGDMILIDDRTHIAVKTNLGRVTAVFNVPSNALQWRTRVCVELGGGEKAEDMAYRSLGNDIANRFGFTIDEDWKLRNLTNV